MQIDNNYILFSPQTQVSGSSVPARASGPTVETPAKPLTPGLWQEEMLELLEMCDSKKTKFSKVNESATSAGEQAKESKSGDEPETGAKTDSKSGANETEAGNKPEGAAGTRVNSEKEPVWTPLNSIDYGKPATEDEGVEAVKTRDGEILKKDTFIKADHFPDIHKLPDSYEKVEGAPNYRKDGGEPIHGTAMPTIDGIRNVLKKTGSGPDCDPPKKTLWTNLREEPVVYIDGRPFNLRDWNNKFNNIENKGIDAESLENMEQKLKREMLAEAGKNGGHIIVHDEIQYLDEKGDTKYKTVPRKVEINEENLKTSKEVFDGLKQEGYDVDYARIPITDEKAPEPKDFDALVARMKDLNGDEELVFNCQMGRGRTTTAMVIASLIKNDKQGKQTKDSAVADGGKPVPAAGDEGTVKKLFRKAFRRVGAVREDIKEQGKYDRGEYRIILRLLNMLEKGELSKEDVDKTIDKYSDLQNLREAINEKKQNAGDAAKENNKWKENREETKAKDYLERYFQLIAFDKYTKEQGPGYDKSFEDWMNENPGLTKTLENIELAFGMKQTAPGSKGAVYA